MDLREKRRDFSYGSVASTWGGRPSLPTGLPSDFDYSSSTSPTCRAYLIPDKNPMLRSKKSDDFTCWLPSACCQLPCRRHRVQRWSEGERCRCWSRARRQLEIRNSGLVGYGEDGECGVGDGTEREGCECGVGMRRAESGKPYPQVGIGRVPRLRILHPCPLIQR